MNLHDFVSQLIIDTKGSTANALAFDSVSSVGVFLPEIVICATIVLMLLIRVFKFGQRIDVAYIALIGSLVGLYLASMKAPLLESRMEIFTGMLVYDTFTIFMRSMLLLFAALFVIFTKLTGIPDHEDGPDIYSLVLGSTLGMCLMASANHLLMVFMAVEMASVPSYVLAGMLKGRRQASEAALKYSVYGAGAAGVMLYGISLICGLTNSAHLPTVAQQLAANLPTMPAQELTVLALGGLMLMVGVAFKLSAVPFHFWAPDVFEGASAEVNAFLSVASKAAALALLVRVAIGFSTLPPEGIQPGESTDEVAVAQAVEGQSASAAGMFAVADEAATKPNSPARSEKPVAASTPTNEDLALVQGFVGKLIAFFAIITCTFGNLAAYGQTNIKRLLAYSTIAHAGYMMMAVPPVLALATTAPAAGERAVSSLVIYIAVYLFMNLGVFAVVAFLRNAMRSEEIADYAGLIRHCPGVVVCFSLMLFSLIGLPPLAGFIGKFAIFASLAEGYGITSEGYLILLLFVGGLNTALSLFYYLRVVKVMIIDPDSETRGPVALPLVSLPGLYLVAITIPTALLILRWDFVSQMARFAGKQLLG